MKTLRWIQIVVLTLVSLAMGAVVFADEQVIPLNDNPISLLTYQPTIVPTTVIKSGNCRCNPYMLTICVYNSQTDQYDCMWAWFGGCEPVDTHDFLKVIWRVEMFFPNPTPDWIWQDEKEYGLGDNPPITTPELKFLSFNVSNSTHCTIIGVYGCCVWPCTVCMGADADTSYNPD